VWCEDACVGEGSCRTWREPQSLVEVSRRISLARTAVTESGNVAVAWIEYESDNAVSKDLMARFYDADTGTWSAPTTVHTTSTYMANVTVAPSGPDGFVFLWDESIDAAVTSRYWTGSSWDGLVTLTPRSSSVQRAYPSNGRSSVLAVWSEYDETPTYTIRASTWEPRTGTWNAPQTLHTSEEYFGEITSTITPESAAFVVWQQAPAVTPNDWELWGARLASGGNNWSAADRFGSALDRQSGFDLGVTQQGDLIGYLAGRLKGVIWDASVTSWIEVNSSGDYTALDLCSLQTNNVLVAEPTRLQRWNRSSGRIAPALDLGAGWARGTLGGRGMRRKDGAHHVVQGRNDALRSVG
jgi:hypothetical protein